MAFGRVVLAFAACFLLTHSQFTGSFDYPDAGLNVNFNDTIIAEWTSDFDPVTLWCIYIGAGSAMNVPLSEMSYLDSPGSVEIFLASLLINYELRTSYTSLTFPVTLFFELTQAPNTSWVLDPIAEAVRGPTFAVFSSDAPKITYARTATYVGATAIALGSTTVITTVMLKTSMAVKTTLTSSALSGSSNSLEPTASASNGSISGEEPSTNGRLNGGMGAAIALGGAIALLIFIVLVWLCVRQKRRPAIVPETQQERQDYRAEEAPEVVQSNWHHGVPEIDSRTNSDAPWCGRSGLEDWQKRSQAEKSAELEGRQLYHASNAPNSFECWKASIEGNSVSGNDLGRDSILRDS